MSTKQKGEAKTARIPIKVVPAETCLLYTSDAADE